MAEPDLDIEGLVEVGARALCAAQGFDWDAQADFSTSASGIDDEQESYRADARAILTAVLPLVLAGPREDLGQALRQWKMYAEIHDDEGDTDLSTGTSAESALYRRARSTLSHIDSLLSKGEG